MLFSSSIFLLVFLPLVLFVYYILLRRHRAVQNIFLLIASLGFYAWGEPWFVLVMIASIVMNWLLGLWAEKTRGQTGARRLTIIVTAVFNLSILFVFKYLTFVLTNIRAVSGAAFAVPEIALPIGISFFTFQAMSYVLDVSRGQAPAQKNPLWVGLYISFFPQLIAGPIVKYQTIAQELTNRRETWDDFSSGLCRFAVGFCKKVLLSNILAVIADAAFDGASLPVALAWLGSFAYTFQIYFDFSGYSDMAIGLGKMFGFHFDENFNYPYISRSITEFWRRWHISLSTWFRDYVYIPLGGSRVSSSRRYFNLFIVWLLTGMWHGANWTFIAWGLFYFVLLVLEKALSLDKRGLSVWRVIPTFLLVNFGWVLFRASSLTAAVLYISAMFGVGADGLWSDFTFALLRDNKVMLIFAVIFSAPIAKLISDRREACGKPASVLYAVGLAALAVIAFTYIAKGAYNPFIYFNF